MFPNTFLTSFNLVFYDKRTTTTMERLQTTHNISILGKLGNNARQNPDMRVCHAITTLETKSSSHPTSLIPPPVTTNQPEPSSRPSSGEHLEPNQLTFLIMASILPRNTHTALPTQHSSTEKGSNSIPTTSLLRWDWNLHSQPPRCVAITHYRYLHSKGKTWYLLSFTIPILCLSCVSFHFTVSCGVPFPPKPWPSTSPIGIHRLRLSIIGFATPCAFSPETSYERLFVS